MANGIGDFVVTRHCRKVLMPVTAGNYDGVDTDTFILLIKFWHFDLKKSPCTQKKIGFERYDDK